MFTFGRLITALVITGTLAGTALAADAPRNALTKQTDTLVAQAMFETTYALHNSVTEDVLTASVQFEPEAAEGELVADITITQLPAPALKDE